MYLKKSTLAIGIVLVVVVTVVFTIGALNPFGFRNIDDFIQFSSVTRLVERNYLKQVDPENLIHGALAGMVSELDDPYSNYTWGKDAEAYMESVSGSYCGVGITIENNVEDDTVRISKIFSGGPAAEAGIVAGDKILKVDGEAFSGKTIDGVQAKVRGDEGTEVTLTILRAKDGETVDVSLTRQKIDIPTVSGSMVTDEVGRINLSQFVPGSAKTFSEKYEELKKAGMKSLIIDLRNNPGGLMEEALELCGQFVENGKLVVYTEDRYGKRENYYAEGKAKQIPVVILTNKYSASASEIFTGALKGYGIAYQIGETTYGKGVVQKLFLTGRDELMTLTKSQYFTPEGACIQGKGIAPDLEIVMDANKYRDTETLPLEEDEQMQAALEYLSR